MRVEGLGGSLGELGGLGKFGEFGGFWGFRVFWIWGFRACASGAAKFGVFRISFLLWNFRV